MIPGIIGLIGPNGAGKTTLIRILATLLKPTSGTGNIFGFDLATPYNHQRIRELLGYLPQETGLYQKLTAEQNLDYFAILKQIRDSKRRSREINRVLEQTGLTEVRKEQAETLSAGTRRRLGIAITLLNEPRLIIVDEPTAGLDPSERMRFRNVLADLEGDRIVLLSTHIIQDVEQMSSDLLVMRDGSLCFRGRPSELIGEAQGYIWAVERGSLLPKLDDQHLLGVYLHDNVLKQRIIAHTQPTTNALPVTPSLEDAYLYVMSPAYHRS